MTKKLKTKKSSSSVSTKQSPQPHSVVGKNTTAQRTSFYIAAALVAIFGFYLFVTPATDSNSQTELEQQQDTTITYQGEDNKTALELLKAKYDVETQSSDFGEFVTGINGKAAASNQFWAFYVNDQMASVGAGSYTTNSSEKITWKLEQIQ